MPSVDRHVKGKVKLARHIKPTLTPSSTFSACGVPSSACLKTPAAYLKRVGPILRRNPWSQIFLAIRGSLSMLQGSSLTWGAPNASPDNRLQQNTTSSRWRVPWLKRIQKCFFSKQDWLAFQRFSVKEQRYSEIVLLSEIYMLPLS